MNIIIVDLEATCTDDINRPVMKEIIEIGAININTGETFSQFVRPKTERTLTEFCTKLTTITQQDIDNAKPFGVVMRQFLDWAGEDFFMLSWGDYDKYQMNKDCLNNNVDWKVSRHLNLKTKYGELKKQKPCGLKTAIYQNGLNFDGTLHRGVDDAININRILKKYPELIAEIKSDN